VLTIATGGPGLRFFRWRERPARGREPTAEQRAAFEEMLLEQDLEGALLAAMEYAMNLTRDNETMARELVLRARTRLWEQCSWDPQKAPLAAALCGMVRSERSNDARRGDRSRKREAAYVTEVETLDGAAAKSAEELAVANEQREEERGQAAGRLEELRARFVAAGDEVNVLWIEYSLDGVEDPAEMARRSGRDVKDFYRARDRRVRLVQRMRAAQREEEDE